MPSGYTRKEGRLHCNRCGCGLKYDRLTDEHDKDHELSDQLMVIHELEQWKDAYPHHPFCKDDPLGSCYTDCGVSGQCCQKTADQIYQKLQDMVHDIVNVSIGAPSPEALRYYMTGINKALDIIHEHFSDIVDVRQRPLYDHAGNTVRGPYGTNPGECDQPCCDDKLLTEAAEARRLRAQDLAKFSELLDEIDKGATPEARALAAKLGQAAGTFILGNLRAPGITGIKLEEDDDG